MHWAKIILSLTLCFRVHTFGPIRQSLPNGYTFWRMRSDTGRNQDSFLRPEQPPLLLRNSPLHDTKLLDYSKLIHSGCPDTCRIQDDGLHHRNINNAYDFRVETSADLGRPAQLFVYSYRFPSDGFDVGVECQLMVNGNSQRLTSLAISMSTPPMLKRGVSYLSFRVSTIAQVLCGANINMLLTPHA